MILHALTAGFLLIGNPAVAAPPSEQPVTLVVGLRSGSGVSLDRVPVLDSENQPGSAITVEVPAGQAAKAADTLRADPAVAYVEPDHVATISAVTPDDPGYSGQWGLKKTGVTTAWATTRGRSDVTIAVVDTGVTAIPDLAGRLLPGHDFVNDDSNATDDNGHGTMAAGVIAAAGNNGTGIAGVCWSCRILPVKVLDAKGSGSYSDIAEGIRWAADRGADIINLSLGGNDDSQLLRDAVGYAKGKGALVIAAAGNAGSPAPHYPAAITSVLAVGGSTEGDARYPWSNYGSGWVDIAAPGCNPAQSMKGVVGQFCGTSSATPFVSGVAALLASTTPAPDATAIRDVLTSTADKLTGKWVASSSGRVNAARALTLENSLVIKSDKVPPVTSFVSPAASALVRGTVTVSARAADDVGLAKVELLVNGKVTAVDRSSPYAFSWNSTALRGGTVTLGLRATDRGGNVAITTRKVTVDNWAPAVTITGGPSGRKTLSVTATATDRSGISRMELLLNGKVVAGYAGSARRFSVPAGTYGKIVSVRVRAYDRVGNVAYTPNRTWRR
ncbi:S8 family serine peptidase [Actinoplanes sp. NPDC051494]|uniref:S8 family serine peptidase n=1 Tax=Actinoplanes sp. NPDC051494 TaxID=3363907 RepID=UPI0037A7DF29